MIIIKIQLISMSFMLPLCLDGGSQLVLLNGLYQGSNLDAFKITFYVIST
jgi:hypothetical protein